MQRGDIYWVSLDPVAGHEQQGRRPVLIISPTRFNRLTQTPLIAPISTAGSFARERGFTVSLAGTGLKTTGVVLCHQPRALDLDARQARRIKAVPAATLDEVLAKILSILD